MLPYQLSVSVSHQCQFFTFILFPLLALITDTDTKFRSFGAMVSPVEFSAQCHLTSELLRFL